MNLNSSIKKTINSTEKFFTKQSQRENTDQEIQTLDTIRDVGSIPITNRKTILMDETKIMKLRED